MAQNKTLNVEPIALTNSAANLLNCNVTSMAGPVGPAIGKPYMIITHMRVVNASNLAVTVFMYKGGTGGSVAGT